MREMQHRVIKYTINGMVTTAHQSVAGQTSISGEESLLVEFWFDSSDPYAVRLVFGKTPWVFDKYLLILPCREPKQKYGEGDVRTFAVDERFVIDLHTPDQLCRVTFPLEHVRQFVERIIQVIPPGSEICDVDDWLRSLGA